MTCSTLDRFEEERMERMERMERRKISGEAEARSALTTIERTGTSIREWAREHGVDGRSLNAWRMALEGRGQSRTRRPASAGLVELVPKGPASAARYMVRFGEISFEFGEDATEETLRRTIGVLRSC